MDQTRPTYTTSCPKQDRFDQIITLCVRWNFEGIINHFELAQNSPVNTTLCSQQLYDRVYVALAAHYPALINQKHAHLQHGNAPVAHTTALIKAKIKTLPEIVYIPDPAPPLYNNMFRSLTHFVRAEGPSIL